MNLQDTLDLHKLWVLNDPEGQRADLYGADLSNANLRYANLRGADLRHADLRHADLSNANLSNANLSNANLRYADLRHADLYGADLSNANLSNANLRGADLRHADLRHADLIGTNLYGTKYTAPIFRLETGTYSVSFNGTHLQIGCKSYTPQEWEDFTDDQIAAMDRNALAFWKEHKNFLLPMARIIAARLGAPK